MNEIDIKIIKVLELNQMLSKKDNLIKSLKGKITYLESKLNIH